MKRRRLARRGLSMQGPALWVGQGGRDEALLCARRLLALTPYRDAGGGRQLRPGAGQQSGKENQVGSRLLDHQRQGPGAGARVRQRRTSDRRAGDRAVDRGPVSRRRAGASRRQARALSRPRMAQFHHVGAAQKFRPGFPADHARRLQGYLQGELGQALPGYPG